MKVFAEVGLRRLARFILMSVIGWFIRMTPTPPLRSMVMKLFGAGLGQDTVILAVSFINLDRTGLAGLRIGRKCYIGSEALFDMAAPINIGDQVTFGPRVMVLTHINVGYADHPLQSRFPAMTAPVTIRDGSFIGAGAILLPGVTVGRQAFVAAGAVVTADVVDGGLVMGVPARQGSARGKNDDS